MHRYEVAEDCSSQENTKIALAAGKSCYCIANIE
jgi:hypothetical protein